MVARKASAEEGLLNVDAAEYGSSLRVNECPRSWATLLQGTGSAQGVGDAVDL